MYLIYTEKMDAVGRAEAEGKTQNLPFWTKQFGAKYISLPRLTAATDSEPSKWALNVESYNLTDAEQQTVVQQVEFYTGQ